MTKYASGEAREWALANLRGACGCVQPTFTNSLDRLNEEAIRFDVRREIELGISGVLLVSECGTTPDEFREFTEIVIDEAGEKLVTVLQASEPTIESTVAAAKMGAEAGVDLVMPSYPLYFNPTSHDDVFEFTKQVADASGLGLIIFAMDQWNFGRLHAAGFPMFLLERMVDEIPQVVSIKNEVGGPGVGGIAAVFERFNDQVVVTDPLEFNAPV